MTLSDRLDDAFAYARRLHASQRRKGTETPYVAHLMAVCAVVLEHGGSEDEAIAALLHDAVEDQGGDAARQEIRRLFGDRVAAIIDGCTDAETIPKPPWEERKRAYVAHIAEAEASVRLVSAADKLHNARAILMDYREVGEGIWDRFNADRGQILWYYRSLADAFRSLDDTPLTRELDRVVGELEALVEASSLPVAAG